MDSTEWIAKLIVGAVVFFLIWDFCFKKKDKDQNESKSIDICIVADLTNDNKEVL